ncbi:hypothetical protein PGT21_030467 [Puccinia graminis f. sp. tritici]|uniref:Uncharacterized protein n=1 Tax=Puccinia graminis f. sp. tritici TaxID=56615 RepID=A0A5B0MGX9_PUCGR|nr:hypothetical protein PGTUg99_029884 [Puccinia graminis f. sp. tritici]KAA1091293.1 hypothetical protein PGT21_030467 [Puccinia graminis f. sp. tritici]
MINKRRAVQSSERLIRATSQNPQYHLRKPINKKSLERYSDTLTANVYGNILCSCSDLQWRRSSPRIEATFIRRRRVLLAGLSRVDKYPDPGLQVTGTTK